MMRALLTAAAAALVLTGLSLSPTLAQSAAPASATQTALGPVLADAQGMTLYTFTRDMTGYSNCNDQCAVAWPPLLAGADAAASGDWSIIVRDDGRRQWAYKGQALYHWSKDAKAGDTTGDGAAGGKWHVAKP
jgi:predicted lipoprotein with Yx(FWY)xxD motif